ncbi:MAG: prepilin-type N-terminal cleavage/methylation domain-containing protein [Microgenomates group bacterium]
MKQHIDTPAGRRGFTLIELIVVVAIILIISVVTLLNYNSYTDRQRVKQAGFTLRSDLRLAQTKATSGQKPFVCDNTTTLQSYEVTFSDCDGKGACYTIQPICMKEGIPVDTQEEISTVLLPSGVAFQTSYLPIQFLSVTGATNLDVDQSIVLTGADIIYTVNVSRSGSISDY